MRLKSNRPLRAKIFVESIAEDLRKNEFLVVIQFRNLDGKMCRLILPKSVLRHQRTLINMLEDSGAVLPATPKKANAVLKQLLHSANAAPRSKLANATGWFDGKRAFVHPNYVIGKPKGDAIIRPPRRDRNDHQPQMRVRGKLKQWAETVAFPAKRSSRLVLGICAALAAPLLKVLDLNSFGILVFGPGKAGKSTLLVVAGSVIGFARESDLPNFRATDAALGELPAAFNDMLLPANELALLKGNYGVRSEKLKDLAYGLGEGSGKTYSRHATLSGDRTRDRWRVIMLGTSEESVSEISAAAGDKRMTGESVRFIDLPSGPKGSADIFDRCPHKIENRPAWAQQRCAALRTACQKTHGAAFKHFIEAIIENRRIVQDDLQPLTKDFVDSMVDESDDTAVRHFATCFGIIAAAGQLAVRFGTLPYKEKFVRSCVKRCYTDARQMLRTDADLLDHGIQELRRLIEGLPILAAEKNGRLRNSGEFRTTKRPIGFVAKRSGRRVATVRAEAWKAAFQDPKQSRLMLDWLSDQKALPNAGRRPRSGTSIVWAESQPTWPDRSRPRSIEIVVRRGLFD
jgi:putative DNA primase/helicase